MSSPKAKRAMLIGIDSMMIKRLDRYASEGRLPALAKLMEQGVSCSAYPTIPTVTDPNWTTIATGADSGTHGVYVMKFRSNLCKAEWIWQAAERVGKQSVVLRYPGGWPSPIQDGITMECGAPANSIGVICFSKCYTNEHLTRFTGAELTGPRLEPIPADLQPATDWQNVPESGLPALTAPVPCPTTDGGEGRMTHLLLLASGQEYDRVVLSATRDVAAAEADFNTGEWSQFVTATYSCKDEDREGTCRFKIISLSPDAKTFTLYRSQVYATSGFTYPDSVAGELLDHCGPYFDNPNRLFLALGWFDHYYEEIDYHTAWMAKAAQYLSDKVDWTLFFTQCHCPDYAEHEWLGGIDPQSGRYQEGDAETWWNAYRGVYERMDAHVGRLLKVAGDDTVVVVVSDHGHIILQRRVLIGNALVAAGLMAVDEAGHVVPGKSKVLPAPGHGFLQINLKGREAEGIVEPGADYERAREQVIEALLGIRDQETGRCPVAVVLRTEEAGLLGCAGPHAPGDMMLLPAAGYGDNTHYVPGEDGLIQKPDPRYGVWGGSEGSHQHLPSVDYSEGTIMPAFVMAGPGVKKGVRRAQPIYLRDIAPTLAHLVGIPCPADADGRILRDLLE